MKNVILTVVALVAVVGAVLMFANFSGKAETGEEMERSKYFLCRDCNEGFSLSLREIAEKSKDPNGFLCPNCGKAEVASAMRCVECGEYMAKGPHGAVPLECPHCHHKYGERKPMPWDNQGE